MRAFFYSLFIAMILMVSITGPAQASLNAPTTWHAGYKLYGSFWDLMGEAGIRNGSMVNVSTPDDVEYWGAVGDNVTDDTDAITNALNNRSVVRFDLKTYKVRNLSIPANVTMIQGKSFGSLNTVIRGYSYQTVLNNSAATGLTIQNIDIMNNTLNNSQVCLRNDVQTSLSLRTVQVRNCGYAINISALEFSVWDSVTAQGSINGLTIYPGTGQAVNLNTFTQVTTRGTAGWGTNISPSGSGSAINNVFINLNADTSANGIGNDVGSRATFINPWTEGITQTYAIRNAELSAYFINPYNGDGLSSTAMWDFGGSPFVSAGISWLGCGGANMSKCAAVEKTATGGINIYTNYSYTGAGWQNWVNTTTITQNGNITFSQPVNSASCLTMRSPDNTAYRLTIANGGSTNVAAGACS